MKAETAPPLTPSIILRKAGVTLSEPNTVSIVDSGVSIETQAAARLVFSLHFKRGTVFELLRFVRTRAAYTVPLTLFGYALFAHTPSCSNTGSAGFPKTELNYL